MSDAMNFDHLVELCRLTHEEMQKQAVRAVDLTLPAIGQTLPDQFAPLLPQSLTKKPTLSAELKSRFLLGWSHYVELLTIDSPDERHFYEIEAAANQWTVRELQRQIASSLYERLEQITHDLEGGAP